VRRVAVTLALAGSALIAPAAAAASGGAATGRVIVLLDGPRSPSATAAAAVSVAGRLARRDGPLVPAIGLVTLSPERGVALGTLLRRLRSRPGVASAQRERRYALRSAATRVPDDPALHVQEPWPGVPAGVPMEWWAWREDFPRAWALTRGRGALVGVIDTGVDASHPDLAGKVAVAVDRDRDPSHGPATTDESGHGTHVASLACGATDNGIGIAGAGWGCRLIVVKSDLTDSSVAAGIVDAADRGAQAINLSFGDDQGRRAPASLVRAVDYANARHVVLVAAAADEPVGEQGNPANLLQPSGSRGRAARGLSVTAAQADGRRAPFAGFGDEVSLAAYGAYAPGAVVPRSGLPPGPPGLLGAFPAGPATIESSCPPAGCRVELGNASYAYLQGTSMAAPQVAAVAAMARALNPALGAGDVIRLLGRTARRPRGRGWEPATGWGILDAGAAIDAARRTDRTPPAVRLVAPRRSPSRVLRLRWSASDPAPRGVVASGIARFEVSVARAGRRRHVIAVTTRRSLRLRGLAEATYSFLVVAVDRAGNRSAATAPARARVRVTPARGA